jgi:hypothetical protein
MDGLQGPEGPGDINPTPCSRWSQVMSHTHTSALQAWGSSKMPAFYLLAMLRCARLHALSSAMHQRHCKTKYKRCEAVIS